MGGIQFKSGGEYKLTAQSTNAGAVLVDDGLVIVTNQNGSLGSGSVVTLGGSGVGRLQLGDPGAVTQTVAGLLAASAMDAVIGGSATTSILRVNNASGTQTYGGKLGGSGTNEDQLRFEKEGGGVFVLTQAATYAGGTKVSAGTLRIAGADDILPSGLGKGGLDVSGTFDINGRSQQVNDLSGSGTGIVDNAAATDARLTFGLENGSSVFQGRFKNTGGGKLHLVKTGTGTTTLSGASTAEGWLSVREGVLELGAGAALASSTVYVAPTVATLKTGAGANFIFGSGEKVGGGGKLMGSFTVGSGALLEPAILDPATSPVPGPSALLTTPIEVSTAFKINGQVKLRLGELGTLFAGPSGTASGAGVSKADTLDISGDLEIGNGSTITVVANDGVNGDGTPTAKEGRYDLIKYTGARAGGFFTNRTDLTTIFNAPSLRPAWFDDTVSKVIGITIMRAADGDFVDTGVNDTGGTAPLALNFGKMFRGETVKNVVRVKMKNASTGGIFAEKMRVQLTDPNNVGVTAPELLDVEALDVDGDELVVTLSTTRARKVTNGLVPVKIYSRGFMVEGTPDDLLVETLNLSVSFEVVGRDLSPWGWGANVALQMGVPEVGPLVPDSAVADEFFDESQATVSTFAAGASHAVFASSDGRLWSLGHNGFGQHGAGAFGGANTAVPVEMRSALTFTQVFTATAGSQEMTTKSVVGLAVGQRISGPELPVDTVIAAVDVATNKVMVSRPATGTSPVSGSLYSCSKRVVQVAAGGTMSLGLLDNGGLLAWGNNANGQLGTGATAAALAQSANPLAVKMDGEMLGWRVQSMVVGGRGYSRVATTTLSSSGTTVTLDTAEGIAVGWVVTGAGIVGAPKVTGLVGSTTVILSSAQTLAAGSALQFISPEGSHGLAVASYQDGSGTLLERAVFGWGRNDSGQLGVGNVADYAVPTRVALPKARASASVSGGTVNAVALMTGGSGYLAAPKVMFSGGGGTGAAATATVSGGVVTGITLTNPGTGYTSPPQVWIASGLEVVEVAAGDYHTLILTSDGSVYACGRNTFGQLGDGTLVSRSIPVKVSFPGSALIRSIGAGAEHSLAVSTTGKVFAWGSNASGQLGLGSSVGSRATVPTEVGGDLAGKTALSVAGGRAHSVVSVHTPAAADPLNVWELYTFGANRSGQLGTGSTVVVSSQVPVRVDTVQLKGRMITKVYGAGDSSYAMGGITLLEPLTSVARIAAGTQGLQLKAQVGGGARVAMTGAPFPVPEIEWYRVLGDGYGEQKLSETSTTLTLSSADTGLRMGNQTAGSVSLTGITTSGLKVGQDVVGTGVPTGAKVASIVNGSSLTLTQAVTSTVAGNTYRFLGTIQYYYVAKQGTDSVVSNIMVMTVEDVPTPPPMITAQPKSQLVVTGSATIQVSAIDPSGSASTLRYKWFRSTNGTTWYSMADTANSIMGSAGYFYRCQVRGANGTTGPVLTDTVMVRAVSTLAGKYIGVFENQDVTFGTTTVLRVPGRLTMDVTSTGSFTGKLDYEGSTYSVSGDVLAAVAGSTISVSRGALQNPVGISLKVDMVTGGFAAAASHVGDAATVSGMATTAGSTTVSVASTSGLLAGMGVSGAGIASGASILSVANGTQFVMSAAATATGSGRVLTYTNEVRSSAMLRGCLTSLESAAQGAYNAAFVAMPGSIVSSVGGLDAAYPFLQVKTGSTGTVTVTGRMADGVTLSGSTNLYRGVGGNVVVPLFAAMYGVYPYAGQVAGELTLMPSGEAKVSGDVEWRKPNVTAWSGTANQKGVYKAGAVVSYEVVSGGSGFAASTFTGDFEADGTWYSTEFVCSAWDTTGQHQFKTSTTVSASNYSGNILAKSIVSQGLTGLSFSRVAGTLNLNYIRGGRVYYGYGLMFPGGKVFGHIVVDDTTGSGSFTAD
jgi:autotransporter-associated beta strand protein